MTQEILTHQIVLLPHGRIVPSALNPRTRFNPEKLAELKASMQEHGFTAALSHLLVRPIGASDVPPGEAYELVIGERRWRAAGELKIPLVPAVIEEMSDARALELQLVENLLRDDLTKLEEAEGIKRMLEIEEPDGSGEMKPVNTRAMVAAKIGCSLDHISDMVALAQLRGTPAGDALEAGKIAIRHARVLARVPAGKLRNGLTKRVLKPADGFAPMPLEQLERIVKEEFMVSLRGADFDLADAQLLPAECDELTGLERVFGGACSDCPHNTGGKGPMCMNPECFREKKERVHENWMVDMTAAGFTPLTVAAAEKVFDITGKKLEWNSGYVDRDAQPTDADLKRGCAGPAWKKLIGGQGVPIVCAKDAAGKVHELVNHDLAIAAARKNEQEKPAAERIFKATGGAATEAAKDAETDDSFESTVQQLANEEAGRNAAADREKAARIVDAQFAAILGAAQTTKIPDDFWTLGLNAICCALARADSDSVEAVAERHGWTDELDADEGYHQALIAGARKMDPGQRFGLIVEMLMWLDLETETTLPKWAKAFGVDLKPIKKRVEAEIKIEEASSATSPGQGGVVACPGEAERCLVPGLEFLPRPPGIFVWNEAGVCENPLGIAVKLKLKKGSVTIIVGQRDGAWFGGRHIELGTSGHGSPVKGEKGRPTLLQAVIDEAYLVLDYMRKGKDGAALVEQMSGYIQALLKLEEGLRGSDPASSKPKRGKTAKRAKSTKKGGK